MGRRVRIAVDAMGGDHAPAATVHGAVEACRMADGGVEVVLVGEECAVREELRKHFRIAHLPIEIVHASQHIAMGEAPAQAVRQKPDSSIVLAMRLLRDQQVDGVVSAGNTGAVMTAALLHLGRIPGVRRPAIGVLLPRENGRGLLIDAGANVDCRPRDLLQFAVMGSVFMGVLFDLERPRVGLLNVGEEPGKGTELVQRAYELLQASDLNFVGNVEGRDVLHDLADVVVTDGFTGNVLLKFGESFGGLYTASLRRRIGKQVFRMLGAWLLKPTFRRLREIFDYQQYGGAPLLGVQGTVIIGHGKSSPRAIRNAIREARKMIEGRVNERIAEQLTQWDGVDRDEANGVDDQGVGVRSSRKTADQFRS
ncbi:MAG: phosphate acyltransferase PlsX [candidate division KSB1 bacterium]|nr:phosphate acyltransferase PlsX [candidate division KSB1 bacterium]